jgi:hypothetical protein
LVRWAELRDISDGELEKMAACDPGLNSRLAFNRTDSSRVVHEPPLYGFTVEAGGPPEAYWAQEGF